MDPRFCLVLMMLLHLFLPLVICIPKSSGISPSNQCTKTLKQLLRSTTWEIPLSKLLLKVRKTMRRHWYDSKNCNIYDGVLNLTWAWGEVTKEWHLEKIINRFIHDFQGFSKDEQVAQINKVWLRWQRTWTWVWLAVTPRSFWGWLLSWLMRRCWNRNRNAEMKKGPDKRNCRREKKKKEEEKPMKMHTKKQKFLLTPRCSLKILTTLTPTLKSFH